MPRPALLAGLAGAALLGFLAAATLLPRPATNAHAPDRLAALQRQVDALRDQQAALGESAARAEQLELELARLRSAVEGETTPAMRALHAYPVPDEVTLCGEPLPLDDPVLYARFEGEWLRFLNNRYWMLGWMRTAPAVFPYVEQELARAGLPDDLKYVMAIESALDARALSSAGARGWWQFMAETGRRHGLAVDRATDERSNLERATAAAIDYLGGLHEEFGSWPLALAAYNAGENRIRSSIAAQGTDDYFHLVLPRETEHYVFRAAAVKALYEDAERYGFVLPDDPRAAGLSRFARVHLQVGRAGLPIRELGEAAGLSYREFKDLNPQFRQSEIPAGEHTLLLPDAAAEALGRAMPRVARLVDPPVRGGGGEPGEAGAADTKSPGGR